MAGDPSVGFSLSLLAAPPAAMLQIKVGKLPG